MVNRKSKGKNRQRLRIQNAKHGTSVIGNDPPTNLAESIRARFAPLGGVELELPPRDPMREPPDFE